MNTIVPSNISGASPEPQENSITVGDSTYTWRVIARGAQGITVQESRREKGKEEPRILSHLLPPIQGRYQAADGIRYLIPLQTRGYIHATGEEIEKGIPWRARGVRAETKAMKVAALQDIWHQAAEQWPIVPPSPSIYEGYPPRHRRPSPPSPRTWRPRKLHGES